MSKVYVKQVPLEYQESPLYFGELPENTIMYGNRNFKGWTTPLFDEIKNNRYDLLEDIEYATDTENKKTVVLAWLQQYCPRDITYTDIDIENCLKIATLYDDGTKNFGDFMIRVLSIVTGRQWKCSLMQNSSQGEWQYFYYIKEEWTDKLVDNLRKAYFNLGTEWVIDEDGFNPETNSPNDINGYYLYCYGDNIDEIKQEIAEAHDCKVEDLVLYRHDSWIRTPTYEVCE